MTGRMRVTNASIELYLIDVSTNAESVNRAIRLLGEAAYTASSSKRRHYVFVLC